MDYIQGCLQIAKALNIPSTAVLTGCLVLTNYGISPSTIKIPDTDWAEPVLLWFTVAMPTGSGKSTLLRYLFKKLEQIRSLAGVSREDPTWILDDVSFEKMGALMHYASRVTWPI